MSMPAKKYSLSIIDLFEVNLADRLRYMCGAMETLWEVMETIQVECHGNTVRANKVYP